MIKTNKQTKTNQELNKPLFEKFIIKVSQSDGFYTDEYHCTPLYIEKVKSETPELYKHHCIALTEIVCNFPRCKKSKLSTIMVIGDEVYIKPLFDYNGEVRITKKEYNNMIMNCQVISDKYTPCNNLTPEIIQDAKNNCLLKMKG
jgi:hypothetical protein